MTGELTLRLLGGLEITLGGVPLPPSLRAKARALVCYLAATGRPHSRDALAALFWGELPEADARNNLRVVLSNLNRCLGHHITVTRVAVALDRGRPYSLDVEAFRTNLQPAERASPDEVLRRTRDAVDLYRGDFLDGFHVRGAPAFEEWVLGQRERLRHLATEALRTLMADATSRQDYPAGLDYTTRLLAVEPWREDARRHLMALLALSGQRDAALAQYETCRRILAEELGVGPADETVALAEQIRSGAPADSKLAVPSPRPPSAVERRQLTVLSCGLVDVAALSESLDPEDLRDVLDACRQVCAEVVGRWGGHLAHGLSGEWLACFGYPLGYEDNAQRAVRAGLEIVERIKAERDVGAAGSLGPVAPHWSHLGVRVGIETGVVMVEGASGGERATSGVVGAAVTTAIRLRERAGPGTVMVGGAAHRLVEGFFNCRPLDARTPGSSGRRRGAYAVLGASGIRGHLEAAAAKRGGLTPLVGREAEVGLLLARWAAARQGRGQVVLLGGEAGLGKSRLAWVLRERAAAEGHSALVCRGSPYARNSPLYPLIELLRECCGFQQEDPSEARLAKLGRALGPYGHLLDKDVGPLLADLLGLPADPPVLLSPTARREREAEAIVHLLRAMAARQPILLVVEDLHWVDPSTLELLGRLIELAPVSPILTLLTFRPSFTPPWPARAHLTTVMLGPLAREQVEALATGVGGDKALPAELLRHVVASSDGVPLYVEELTRAALEAGSRRTSPGPALPPLPATLRDSLTARLDRLATAKPVAQMAAVIGREFSPELLRTVTPLDETVLDRELERLVEAGLLFRGGPSSGGYVFKHALVQEAAYRSLPKRKRRQVHQQVAVALAERFPATAEAQPELLAEHYTRAGLAEPAIAWWQPAGERAIQRSANLEAVSHLTRALALLQATPDTPARVEPELKLQVALAAPLAMVRGYTAPEVGRVLDRARALSGQLGETVQLFPVLRGLMSLYGHRGELTTARAIGEQLLRLASREHDPALLLEAHAPLGWVAFHSGRFGEAQSHLEQSIARYDLQEHRDHLLVYGLDAGVYSMGTGALVLWLQGYPDRAATRSRAALDLARATAYPINLVLALYLAAVLHSFRREVELVRERAAEALARSDEHRLPHYRTMAAMLAGAALTIQAGPATAELEAGLAQMRRETATFRTLGVALRSFDAVLLGSAYRKAGRPGDGLRLIDEALGAAATTGDRWCEAELHRMRGELLLGRAGEDAEVEACFRRAIELARQQEAKSFELRAAISLGRLRQRRGDRADARRLLDEVVSRFTEGFGTADLHDAAVLLKALT